MRVHPLDGQAFRKTIGHLQKYRITQGVWKWLTGRTHYGVDFAAKEGTPIKASVDSVIIGYGVDHAGYGRYVKLESKDGQYRFTYAHLTAYASFTRKGKQVKEGEVFCWVGNTGRSTGAHLHWEMFRRGKNTWYRIDPERWLKEQPRTLKDRVNSIFRGVFGRDPDHGEWEYWYRRINHPQKRIAITTPAELANKMHWYKARGRTKGKKFWG